jgi:hypothetical protein
MFPGFVFFLLFGLEVFIGGMITEPGLFPIRLVWLGMALLINKNYRSAVFWGTLGGVSKDLLSHGLIGLNGISYLFSLAILQWISKKKLLDF